jgi:hypothetical protein
MTETIGVVPDRIDQQQLAQQVVEAARAEGAELVGPGGLLTGLTKTVLETALEAEMAPIRAPAAQRTGHYSAPHAYSPGSAREGAGRP